MEVKTVQFLQYLPEYWLNTIPQRNKTDIIDKLRLITRHKALIKQNLLPKWAFAEISLINNSQLLFVM